MILDDENIFVIGTNILFLLLPNPYKNHMVYTLASAAFTTVTFNADAYTTVTFNISVYRRQYDDLYHLA